MPGAKIGERVCVICGKAEDGVIDVFGYGVRIEDAIPEPGVLFMGIDMHELGCPSPTLRLDNGDTVYGCECWWGSEKRIQKSLEGQTTREITVASYREKARKQMEAEKAEAKADGG